MTRKKVHEPVKMYLASPLGFTEEGREYIRNKLIPKLSELRNVEILDPWKAVLGMNEDKIRQLTFDLHRDTAMGYGRDNFNFIDKSDIVLANLNGSDPDSGTCIEVGYACKAGKLVVGYRTDYRTSGESIHLLANLQVEAAIEKSGGKFFRSLEEAIAFIKMKI